MLPNRDAIPAMWTLARATLAGIGGVTGSFALAGFTPSFIAAPIAGFLAREMPAVVIRFSIVLLGSLGQKLNLLAALGISTLLLALVALLGIEAEARTEVPFIGTAAATVSGAGLGWLLTGSPTAALGVGGGIGVVLAASGLSSRAEQLDGAIDPRRRTVIGGIAAVAGIGVASALRRPTGRSSPAPEEPAALSEAGADTTPNVATTHTATPKATTPEPATSVEVSQSTAASEAPTPSTTGTPLADTATPTATPQGSTIGRLLDEAEEKSLDVFGLEPLVSDSFYEVDINAVNPKVDTEDWSLRVTGAVEEEQTYSWADVTSMPAEHRFVTLRCVGEALNGKKMDNALWTGIPVNRLLDAATPTSECECVMLRAADGFFEEFPLEALRGGLLAYGMNGEVLPRGHGQPLRALVPGHWGEVNVKWLTEIELLESEQDGYWEKRGWHGTGPVHTVAKLHAVNHFDNGRIEVGGHAYAGTRGIERVEVSIDGGSSWATAKLSEPLPGEDAWRQWAHVYDTPGNEHDVVVRAVDGTGTMQPEGKSQPFPEGATGWVSRSIQG